MCLIGIAIGNRSTCRTVKSTPSVSMVATRCRSCGSLKCQCSPPQKGYACASSRSKLKLKMSYVASLPLFSKGLKIQPLVSIQTWLLKDIQDKILMVPKW